MKRTFIVKRTKSVLLQEFDGNNLDRELLVFGPGVPPSKFRKSLTGKLVTR